MTSQIVFQSCSFELIFGCGVAETVISKLSVDHILSILLNLIEQTQCANSSSIAIFPAPKVISLLSNPAQNAAQPRDEAHVARVTAKPPKSQSKSSVNAPNANKRNSSLPPHRSACLQKDQPKQNQKHGRERRLFWMPLMISRMPSAISSIA